MPYSVCIDIGGSKIAFAAVVGQTILARTALPTPQKDTFAFLQSLHTGVQTLLANSALPGEKPCKIGIGFPGFCTQGVVVHASNLHHLQGVDLATPLQQAFGCPVHLENDANCAALGEYHCGALQNARVGLMLTLGTGVGGGVVAEGRLLSGAQGCAGEIGHTTLVAGGLPCGCGRKGCLEQYSSTTALLRMARAQAQKHPSSLLHTVCGTLGALNGKGFFNALHAGDTAAGEAFAQFLYYLGEGLVSLCNAFNPDMVAIGGGISAEHALICPPLQAHVRQYAFPPGHNRTRVVPAQLLNDAGLLGASFL